MARQRVWMHPALAALCLATLGGCGEPSGPVAPAAGSQVPLPAPELFLVEEALFRPTADGATLHWITRIPVEATVQWGHERDRPAFRRVVEGSGAMEVVLDGLEPGRRAFYHCEFAESGGGRRLRRPTRDFMTARPPGETYRVGLIADSHVYRLDGVPGARPNLARTMQRCLEDDLDFVVFLGDEAGVHFVHDAPGAMNQERARERWRDWRLCFTPLLGSVPTFMVLGNHEGEAGYYQAAQLRGVTCSYQRWGTIARKEAFLNPLPDTYPEGGEDAGWREVAEPDSTAGVGDGNASPLQNYFAWTWGDALFVALDVHRYTCPGGDTPRSVDDWTLGPEQLAWLEQTLRESRARWKFVLAHHLVGGWDYNLDGTTRDTRYKYGRGGARYARVGEQARITSLMRESDARFFLYGHDHVFAHQSAEDVEFVCCGRPTFLQPGWWKSEGWREAYGDRETRQARDFLAGIGYTRLTIGPEQVRLEYVRTGDDPAGQENVGEGPVLYSWTTDMTSPAVELLR